MAGMKRKHRGLAGATAARHPDSQPSAVGAPTATTPAREGRAASSARGSGAFRFWHEERRFKPAGSTCVVQDALYALGGVRTGGYPRAAPVPGPLGWQRPGDWDLLWAPARLALRAAAEPGQLKPGQLISAVPGLMALTRKRQLPTTLHAALGEGAWWVVPHSFSLPEQLPQLQAHIQGRIEAGAGAELWILKTAQHLGKGLKVLPAAQLCAAAAAKRPRPGVGQEAVKPFVLAQRYVDNPLLLEGRKFGIRVWVLVTGHDPLRAYIHSQHGLVLFASNQYDGEAWQGEDGAVGLGHVTNYAQNTDGLVWDLQQLRSHLGEEAYGRLWGHITHSVALMCAAALPHMREQAALLNLPPESAFELLGLDYLVDSQLHPWLLEVNGTPSLAVDHVQPEVESLIHTQKAGMTRDMFKLLGCEQRFAARYEAARFTSRQQAQAKAQAQSQALQTIAAKRAGFVTRTQQQEAGSESDDDDSGPHEETVAARPGRGASSSSSTAAGAKAAAVVLPRRIRDALFPKTDEAVLARASAELARSGGFTPVMHLFSGLGLGLASPSSASGPRSSSQAAGDGDSEQSGMQPQGACGQAVEGDGCNSEQGPGLAHEAAGYQREGASPQASADASSRECSPNSARSDQTDGLQPGSVSAGPGVACMVHWSQRDKQLQLLIDARYAAGAGVQAE